MKIILTITTFLISNFSIKYISEIKKLELIIYQLYQSEFNDYLIFKDEELSYDKKSLKQYMEKNGYKIKFFDEVDLHFYLSFKNVFKYEKEFKFELVKNNDF